MKVISKILLTISICALLTCMCDAGSLQPTEGPGPTMKNLNEIEPRIAIPAGSFNTTYHITTSGSYYLAGNRTLTANVTGISIDANNVTLDLNGFTLTGTGSGDSSDGIYLSKNMSTGTIYKNIEIRNGTVIKFGHNGIGNFYPNKDIRISNINSIANKLCGIYLLCKGSRIENCLSAENQYAGIFAGENSIINNCIVRDTNDVGIRVNTGSIINGCMSYSNKGDGIFIEGYNTNVTNSNCFNNVGHGIAAYLGGVTLIGNTVKANSKHGIHTISSGIIKNNNAFNNGNCGFNLGGGSIVVNNLAQSNTVDGFHGGGSFIGNSAIVNGNYGFYILPNSLVDQNYSSSNLHNMNVLENCTVPSGNQAN